MIIKNPYINGERKCSVAIANNFFYRLRGMIGRDFKSFDAMAIMPCNEIHMFFMKFPLDVVYVDKNGLVVRCDKNVPINTACGIVKGAKTTIEMPVGAIEKYNIVLNDKLEYL